MRNVAITAFIFWAVLIGTTVPAPLFPLYEKAFGIGPLDVTVLFGVYAIGVVAGLVALGKLSDQIGRRPVMALALLLSAAAAAGFIVAGSFWMLLCARVLSGLSAALVIGAANAALGEQLPRRRERLAPVLALLANMGGLAMGALLAGLLAQWDTDRLRLSWVVDLALVLVGLLGLTVVNETVVATRPYLRVEHIGVPAELRGEFTRVAATAGSGFGVLGVMTSVTGILLATALGEKQPALTGLIVFLTFSSTAAGQLLDHRLPPAVSLPAACVALTAGSSLIAAAVLVPSLPLLFAAAVVVGLGAGIGFSAGLRAINARVPSARRGAAFSAFFVVLYAALALPAIGVGVMIEIAGLRWAGGVFSSLVAMVSVLVLLSLRDRAPAGR